MPYKTEIKNIKPGDWFYFSNDPDLKLLKKLQDKRKTEAKQIFVYCEDAAGSLYEYNENRSIMAFYGREVKTPTAPLYEKEPSASIHHSPFTIKPNTCNNNAPSPWYR